MAYVERIKALFPVGHEVLTPQEIMERVAVETSPARAARYVPDALAQLLASKYLFSHNEGKYISGSSSPSRASVGLPPKAPKVGTAEERRVTHAE